MNANEFFPSKYLSAVDLQGHVARVVIDRIERTSMGDGKIKPIVFFQNKSKGLALNKTNSNTIINVYGPETDNWIGAELELFETMVDFQGKSVPAIRVRVPPRAAVQRPTAGPVNQSPQPAPVARRPEPAFSDDIPF